MFKEPNFSREISKKNISSPSKKEEISVIRNIYEKLKKEKGQTGADLLMAEISQGKSAKDLFKRNEQIPNLEEAKKVAFLELEKQGFIFYSKDDQIICDSEKMKDEMNISIIKKFGDIYTNKYLGGGKIEKTLSLLFQDFKVISKRDWESGINDKKDLIYSPKTTKEALDLKKLKASRFQLTLKDLIKAPHYDKINYGEIPKEDLDFREVILPVLIYHPQYGNGYRDPKDGKLYIINKETNQPVKLSSEYIQKNWGNFGHPNESGESFAQPKLFIKKHLPHLAEKGLLTPEDFTVRVDKRNRQMSDRFSTVIKKRHFTFNSVDHSIGSQYLGKKIYQLSNNQGAVVDENENILATFSLFRQQDDLKTNGSTDKRDYYFAKLEKTNPQEFSKEILFVKKSKEKEEDYQKRISEVAEFRDVLEISDKILVEENINLVNLDFKNQLLVATLCQRIGERKFMEFIHEYRLDGLRSCLALENGNEMEKIILQIGEQKEKDPKFSARLVFRKYNQIIKEKENLNEIIGGIVPEKEFNKNDFAEIINNFEMRMQRILEDFSQNVGKLSVDEVDEKLGMIQKEMIFIGAVLKLFKERKGEFSLDNIKGLKIQEIGAEELNENPELWKKLESMYRVNNSHKSKEDLARLMHDFENHQEYNSKFYLIYFDQKGGNDPEKSLDNLVGFMRSSGFDGQKQLGENERYLGALNISPILQKFYFGENFLREVLEKELTNGAKKIVAHFPKDGASHKMIESLSLSLKLNRKETQEGEYKNNDGEKIAERLRVELTES